jgi:DNA polymerase-4
MNNYYASVESLFNPQLRNVPMAVCGDPAMRHGVVLAKNELAKSRGVITGESVYAAKQKCPNLTTVMPDFARYEEFAEKARRLYREYTQDVIPFGLDEAWIVLSNAAGRVDSIEKGKFIADDIRARIKAELGLTASVGVSYNYIFSKLASDLRKPDATSVLAESDLQTVIWQMPVSDLLFVGKVTRKKLTAAGVHTIGDLARSEVKMLKSLLGKSGEMLWLFANGDDRSFDPHSSDDDPFKSIANTITMPYDLVNELDILTMLYVLAKSVSERLRKHTYKAACVAILLKFDDFKVINRQTTVALPIDSEYEIYKYAKRLFLANFAKQSVRSVGVSVSRLYSNKYEQLSLFDSADESDNTEIAELEANLQGRLRELKVEKYFDVEGEV